MKTDDWRNIRHGLRIPTETYSDQPYIVTTDDGAWLCVVTTGAGHEGQGGQHVITMRSTDRGQTWSTPVDVEPASGPEASYAVLLKVPEGSRAAGRIFVFYNHNTDNVREVLADRPAYPDGVCRRVDSLGHFVYRISDDGGLTWSTERYDVPMRTMEIDRQNPYGGELKFFWNVGKPFVHAGSAYVPLHKVGGFGEGFFTRSEGVLLHSPNLLSVDDPGTIVWETLPEGEIGLRTPPGGGPIAEEQSYVVLSDGSFYVVYRTIDGHPVEAYSRDGGRTWTEPRYMTYADGRLIKHPRAANFVWRCANGHYLYWFHNHGGRFIREHPRRRSIAYEDRNPVWLCGGIEAEAPEGKGIRWSQPNIVLYDDDPYVRMSYPDLVEDGDRVFLTETQKNVARVHEIPTAFLDALWNRDETHGPETDSLILTYQPLPLLEVEASQSCALGGTGIPMPALPPFLQRNVDSADYGTRDLRSGFSIDVSLRLQHLVPGDIVLDNRTPTGQGFCLQIASQQTVEIVLNDGRTENRWACDPGQLTVGRLHRIVAIVDGGPKIITFIIDGVLNDGGDARQFGWGRFSPHLRSVNGAELLRIGPTLHGEVLAVRLYARALPTSEALEMVGPGAAGYNETDTTEDGG